MKDSLTEDEFERRFLVAELAILDGAQYQEIHQAYIWKGNGYAVRVRAVREPGAERGEASFALKGPRGRNHRYSRFEAEMPLDYDHAVSVAAALSAVIIKRRYAVISEGNPWMIDVFDGKHTGLVIAEFEASRIAVERLRAPWWAGREVTADTRYSNEELAFRAPN